MDAEWDVLFIPQFQRDLSRVSQETAYKWLGKLEFLRRNPYEPTPNAKRLKGKSRLFRLRVGDWRLVYRVVDSARQVVLLAARPRGDVYDQVPRDATPQGPIDNVLSGSAPARGAVGHPSTHDSRGPAKDDEIATEQPADPSILSHPPVEWESETLFDRDELYILGIPDNWHAPIERATAVEELEKLGVPRPVRTRLEDYLTNPNQTHVGRIYALGDQHELASIASQPLSDFLLALDPQQREIVERPLDSGPLMVRGGPGTGKTLICVYRLKRLYHERATESLFSRSAPVFAFVTYNRALTRSNKAVFDKILPEHAAADVRFSTLDRIIYHLAGKMTRGKRPSPRGEQDLKPLLMNHVIKPLSRDREMEAPLSRLSPEFLLEEIDSIIHGNGIESLEEYLAFQRRGRKVPLQRSQRSVIWRVYENFCQVLHKRNWTTWERQRLDVLRAVESGQIRYRPADALVVDELQDLSITSIRLLVYLVRDPRFLMLAADGAQSIYNKAPAWRDVSPKLRFHRGNSFVLRRSYRMTRQIANAIAPLRCDPDEDRVDNAISNAVFTGPEPIWRQEPQTNHAGALVQIVLSLTRQRRINAGQIGVVVRFENQLSVVRRQLENLGVSVNSINRDEPVDLDGECVHVVKVHSAKGLEFPFLIVPYVADGVYPFGPAYRACSDEKERDELLEQEQKLLYVAFSRAARGLWIIVDPQKPSPLLHQLTEEDWDLQ